MIEKYAAATRSTNLRNDPYRSSIDAIMAMGLAAPQVASTAIRAKFAAHPAAIHQLYKLLIAKTLAKAATRKWPADVCPVRVAKETVNFWLDSSCRVCTGTKFVDHRECPLCQGSGKREIPLPPAQHSYLLNGIAFLNITVARAGRAFDLKLA